MNTKEGANVLQVKQQLRALRQEKEGTEEAKKRDILRKKLKRLKRLTRKLAKAAKLQASSAPEAVTEAAGAAQAASTEGSKAAETREGSAASEATAAPTNELAQPQATGEDPAPAEQEKSEKPAE